MLHRSHGRLRRPHVFSKLKLDENGDGLEQPRRRLASDASLLPSPKGYELDDDDDDESGERRFGWYSH